VQAQPQPLSSQFSQVLEFAEQIGAPSSLERILHMFGNTHTSVIGMARSVSDAAFY
jgi:hypothetical protein